MSTDKTTPDVDALTGCADDQSELGRAIEQLREQSAAAAEAAKRAGVKQHPRITDAIRRRERWRDIANGRD